MPSLRIRCSRCVSTVRVPMLRRGGTSLLQRPSAIWVRSSPFPGGRSGRVGPGPIAANQLVKGEASKIGTKIGITAADCFNGPHELIGRRLLADIAVRARLEAPQHIFCGVVHGEEEHLD